MIYDTKSRTFKKYLLRGCSFVEVTTAAAIGYDHYMTARQVMKVANGEVPMFEVKESGQALSLSCFAATPEECQRYLKNLCFVICTIKRRVQGRFCHEVSEILYLPNIDTSCFPKRCSFAKVLRSNLNMKETLQRLGPTSALTADALAVTVAPCVLTQQRVLTATQREMDASSSLCIVCFEHPRLWRWSKCLHTTDGPALVCHRCKKRLLQAQRDAQGIEDKRAFVYTHCLICNKSSEFQKMSQFKDAGALPAGFQSI